MKDSKEILLFLSRHLNIFYGIFLKIFILFILFTFINIFLLFSFSKKEISSDLMIIFSLSVFFVFYIVKNKMIKKNISELENQFLKEFTLKEKKRRAIINTSLLYNLFFSIIILVPFLLISIFFTAEFNPKVKILVLSTGIMFFFLIKFGILDPMSHIFISKKNFEFIKKK